ncbi:MAG: DUF4097 family beta strand repeat-containing protein [Bacteroidota bacterium]
MKQSTFLQTVIFSLILFQFCSLHAQDHVYDLDESYPIDPNGLLTLYSNDAEVTIKGSDVEEVHLVVHREVVYKKWPKRKDDRDFFVEVELDKDEVIIRERQESSGSGIYWTNEKNYTITLEVPNGMSLKLYGDDDDYLIEDIQGTIVLDAEDGDAELKHCTGDKFDLRMDDGTVYLSHGTGKLFIRGEDGDFMIEKGSFEQVDARMDDGTIYLSSEFYDEGSYELQTEDGEIDLEMLAGGGDIIVRMSDGDVRWGKGFDVKEDSDHKVKLYHPAGSSRIYIDTDDGDISIKRGIRAN